MLDRLLAGALPGEPGRWAMAHLVSGCAVCWRHLRAAAGEPGLAAVGGALGRPARRRRRPGTGPGLEEALETVEGLEIGGAYDAAYDAAFAGGLERSAAGVAGVAAIRADQLEAVELWVALQEVPRARRLELVVSDPRYHTWALAARLLEGAGELQWRDTGEEIGWCRLAFAIAGRLPADRYPAALGGDLRARALGGLADALRLGGSLAAAGEALEGAWEALDEGSGDPLERAALLRFAANLQLTLGDGAAAADLLRPAVAIYRLYGDRHQQGRTLQKLALAVGHDDPQAGVSLAERALALVEPGREPRAELAARHALVWFLNDCGLGGQALELLEQSRRLYGQCGDGPPQLAMPWLEARICRRLGRLAAAERGLAGAWHQFRAAGLHQELTLVSLDLAEALTAQGKRRHALRLLTSCEGSLRRWRMHAEGLAAWRLVLAAASGTAEMADGGGGGGAAGGDWEREADVQAAQALLRAAALYFRRAWRRALPFTGLAGMTDRFARGRGQP
jgi:hypothetical protein